MVDDLITAVVTTSPAPLHPSTEHIETVLDSIRYHLPSCEIVIVADGGEGDHYAEYLRRLVWLCNTKYSNTVPVLMDDWQHQASCTRKALEFVQTPLILYVEHDTNLCPDPIEWGLLTQHLLIGASQMIRFHYEGRIHPEHLHLMLDTEPRGNLPMIRTIQWSQRPHLATTALYSRILNEHFPPTAKAFIEDKMHSVVQNSYSQHGVPGWAQYGMWIYNPKGPHIKRSDHLDSRAGAEKAPAYIE